MGKNNVIKRSHNQKGSLQGKNPPKIANTVHSSMVVGMLPPKWKKVIDGYIARRKSIPDDLHERMLKDFVYDYAEARNTTPLTYGSNQYQNTIEVDIKSSQPDDENLLFMLSNKSR